MEIFGLRALLAQADVPCYHQPQPVQEKAGNLHGRRGDGQGRGSLERERVGEPLQEHVGELGVSPVEWARYQSPSQELQGDRAVGAPPGGRAEGEQVAKGHGTTCSALVAVIRQ